MGEREQPSQVKLINDTCNYLRANLSKKHSLASIAKQIGTNRTDLCRLFKERMNASVFDWLRSERMEESRRLLIYTEQSVQDIALDVGIENLSTFSTVFKKNFGVSPMFYRESVRNPNKNVRIKKHTN